MCCTCVNSQGAASITTFEIMPQPPASRAPGNPWPTWPVILRVDYGHAEVQLKFDKDPRIYNIMSKVSNLIFAYLVCPVRNFDQTFTICVLF